MKNECSELPVLEFELVHSADGAHVGHLVDLLFESSVVGKIASEERAELVEGGDPFLLRVLRFEIVPELFRSSTFDGLLGVSWILKLAKFEGDRFDYSLFDETECGFLSVGRAVGCSSGGVVRLLLPVIAHQNFPYLVEDSTSVAQSL